jgi:hypothetical protein
MNDPIVIINAECVLETIAPLTLPATRQLTIIWLTVSAAAIFNALDFRDDLRPNVVYIGIGKTELEADARPVANAWISVQSGQVTLIRRNSLVGGLILREGEMLWGLMTDIGGRVSSAWANGVMS